MPAKGNNTKQPRSKDVWETDLQSSNMAEREMKEGSGERQAEVWEALT